MKKHAVDFGQRFGKLTARKLVYIGALAAPPPRGVYVWGCECDCGGELFARSDDLAAGRVKVCNQCSEERYAEPKIDDLTGELFGRVHVLKSLPTRVADAPNRFWEPLYLVECSCGRRFRARQQSLLEGCVQACRVCDPK
ncbi:MAG: hypothetical protein IKY97_07770 [Mailhella sp.]|nr:hypothetical protein [Mailhella sp.]